jgi:hypothetical protein
MNRLQKIIDVDAPAVIVGSMAWHLYCTILACYGQSAGSTMIQHIRDENLHSRGVCSHEDCTEYVERPGVGLCAACCTKLGIDEPAVEVGEE